VVVLVRWGPRSNRVTGQGIPEKGAVAILGPKVEKTQRMSRNLGIVLFVKGG
jgi:hypothetical protein